MLSSDVFPDCDAWWDNVRC